MKLTLEQFETKWAENNLSTTDWFDTTYGLFKELEELQSRSCLSCTSCNKDTQLMSCPPQYTLSCGVFNTVFVNDFKQSCSRYEAKEQ